MGPYTTGRHCPFCGSLNVREDRTALQCDSCLTRFDGIDRTATEGRRERTPSPRQSTEASKSLRR